MIWSLCIWPYEKLRPVELAIVVSTTHGATMSGSAVGSEDPLLVMGPINGSLQLLKQSRLVRLNG